MAIKSAEETVKSAKKTATHSGQTRPDVHKTDLPDGKLQVSRSFLRFDRAIPGQESYLILKVTPPVPGASVSLSTDEPDVFQVAVGVDKLEFDSTLTFVPQDKGTYVHLRYWPKQAGSHRSLLTLQTQDETLTVRLSGRTLGIGGVVLNRRQHNLSDEPVQRGWAMKALLSVALLGLFYAGYQYRCQLLPSLCTADTQPAATVISKPAPVPTSPAPQLSSAVRPKKAKSGKTRAVATRSETVVVPNPVQPVKEPAPAPQSIETPQPQPQSQQGVVEQNVPKVSKKAAANVEKVAQRPATPAPAAPVKQGNESELERILNQSGN